MSTRRLSSCPFCGRSCRRVHDRRRREIRDLEHGGRPTVLLWTQRRFVCNHCGKRHMETHSQFEGGLSRRLARRLVQDAQVMPISAVSRRHRVGWHLVMGLLCDWSGLIQTRRRRQKCRVLLIDETSIRKRHRYVTVILNGDTGELLAMFPERSKASLSRFFIEQGPRWCQNVKTVVTDGSHSYRAAIHRYLPRARHVLDRFHAVRWFTGRTDPGTPRTATPPTPRSETGLRTGPVPRPVLSAETKRPSHPCRPTTSPASVRCSSPSQSGLGRLTGALRPVRGQRSPRRPGSPRPFRGPLQQRTDSRVPRHRGHHPQLGRRNPELAPQPPFQRTPRRHQQPNPNPPQNRPRLHKPPKLRRPRTPPNMNPTTNQPDHNPTNSRRANSLRPPG